MAIRVNRGLLEAQQFDSGALGPAASVAHQFMEPGTYHVAVRHNELQSGFVEFEVADSATEMQLDIDLSTITKVPSKPDKARSSLKVKPGGYVLFWASTGTGYSAAVAGGKSGAKVTFDTQVLQENDVFALSLLEPVTYKVVNTLGKATGRIVVDFKEQELRRRRGLPAVQVQTYTSRFEPDDIHLMSTQGLVFFIREKARVVVAREGKRPQERTLGHGYYRRKKPIQ